MGETPNEIHGLKAVVFDMDGTILHTFPDLAAAAHEAFAVMGFPPLTDEEILAHMGFGGRWMMWQLAPDSATNEQCEQVFELWRERYIQSGYTLTEPFPGMVETIRALRQRGMKTGVLSNKFHEGACMLAEQHFPGLFDIVRGDAPPTPRKPDPASLLQILDDLGVSPDEAAYVGDTAVDVETARNAGVTAIGVSWGYDKVNPLPRESVDSFIVSPTELLDILQQ